ncbi:NINE protein [Hydrogenophaga sp. RWCD_12]|uniref:NINE protein n=1 Tax=Hydrogenophaga sp. RWCD_12 TaxID=3391190 RepID=UPI00398482EE
MSRPKNKTLTVWLALLGGHMGLHRFYLRGLGDWIGWLHPIASALGWWGIERVRELGQDDPLSWVLIPFLGMSIAISCLAGIVYALAPRERWNGWFNPALDGEHAAGATNWFTIGALILSLLVGTIAFMSSLAFGFQRYYEYQVEEARKLSQ